MTNVLCHIVYVMSLMDCASSLPGLALKMAHSYRGPKSPFLGAMSAKSKKMKISIWSPYFHLSCIIIIMVIDRKIIIIIVIDRKKENNASKQ